jgi:hypothetical protein
LFRLRLGTGACRGGDGISGWGERGRAFVGPLDFASVEVDIFGGEFLVESCEFSWDFNLFHDYDTGSDFPCHHFQRLEGLLQVSAGEPDEEAVIGYSELVACLAAALKEAPFELSDEAGETSRRRVYELELVLDITLRIRAKEGEYGAFADH